ncbi:MAG: type II 3-dehydroquinate dehydratase [Lachnospiraceae bacterium]|nr:type II 3-dehydroquinate dehydratase [Lachnospiraceae bacterium]
MKIRVINGPNLNMLGIREPEIYGHTTYGDLVNMIKEHADKTGVEVECMQSNHEGDLVDMIQDCLNNADGIVINPGAYTHTSIAILDALRSVSVPAVEVHISDPDEREGFRKVSYIREACIATIKGHGINGYLEAMDRLIKGGQYGMDK